MTNLQEILDKLDRWYAGIDGADDDYLDPEEAQAAIAELVEGCLPQPENFGNGYDDLVSLSEIRNNLKQKGII